MEIVTLVLGAAGLLAAFALIGWGWNYLHWLYDGRPSCTEREWLRIDVLRYQGRSLTGARREVLRARQSVPSVQVDALDEVRDLVLDPDRETEFSSLTPAITQDILSRPNTDSVKQSFVETLLTNKEQDEAKALLSAIRQSDKREHVTGVVSDIMLADLRALDRSETQRA